MAYITLLSDFGLQDASVAVAKGILIQHVPGLHITDITHEIVPFNLKQAAYILGATSKIFPAGTCHIPLFDIFCEQNPVLVLAEHEGQYYLVPDNGILPRALGTNPTNAWQVLALQKEHSFHQWLRAAGDIVSALQTKKTSELGLKEYTLKTIPAITMPENGILEPEAIHIDIFGNVIIDYSRQQHELLSKGKKLNLQFIRFEEIKSISNNYNDVPRGEKLCRFNSNNYLEICLNRGKASELFGLKIGSKHNHIKISFK